MLLMAFIRHKEARETRLNQVFMWKMVRTVQLRSYGMKHSYNQTKSVRLRLGYTTAMAMAVNMSIISSLVSVVSLRLCRYTRLYACILFPNFHSLLDVFSLSCLISICFSLVPVTWSLCEIIFETNSLSCSRASLSPHAFLLTQLRFVCIYSLSFGK